MKQLFARLCPMALLSLISSVRRVQAQTAGERASRKTAVESL